VRKYHAAIAPALIGRSRDLKPFTSSWQEAVGPDNPHYISSTSFQTPQPKTFVIATRKAPSGLMLWWGLFVLAAVANIGTAYTSWFGNLLPRARHCFIQGRSCDSEGDFVTVCCGKGYVDCDDAADASGAKYVYSDCPKGQHCIQLDSGDVECVQGEPIRL